MAKSKTEGKPVKNGYVEPDMGDEMGSEESNTPEKLDSANASVKNTLTVTTDDVPEIEGMQVGDTISLNAQATIERVNSDGTYDVTVDMFMPAEVSANEQPPMPEAGAGAGAQMGGQGGLASLLGGGK